MEESNIKAFQGPREDRKSGPVKLCPAPRAFQVMVMPTGTVGANNVLHLAGQMGQAMQLQQFANQCHELRAGRYDTDVMYCVWCAQAAPQAIWQEVLGEAK